MSLSKVVYQVQAASWITPTGQAAVQDVSFEIRQGEVFGIIGPNGAGKTSLLKLLYRTYRAESGEIFLNGQDVKDIPRTEFAQQVAVVLQESPANFALTVRDVVATGRLPYLRSLERFGADHTKVVDECLKRFELVDMQDRRFSVLSGGEKQRVVFARALAQQSPVLILDEPTNHLDIRHQLDVMRNLKDWADTVILTVHDINLAARYCDRLLVLHNGRAVACGAPADILTSDLLERVFRVSSELRQEPRYGQPWFAFYADEAALPDENQNG